VYDTAKGNNGIPTELCGGYSMVHHFEMWSHQMGQAKAEAHEQDDDLPYLLSRFSR